MRFECARAREYFDLARAALKDEDKRFFLCGAGHVVDLCTPAP